MGPGVQQRIRRLKRLDAVLDGIEFKKLRMISQDEGMYGNQEVLSVHNINYDGAPTKVQVVLNRVKNNI